MLDLLYNPQRLFGAAATVNLRFLKPSYNCTQKVYFDYAVWYNSAYFK